MNKSQLRVQISPAPMAHRTRRAGGDGKVDSDFDRRNTLRSMNGHSSPRFDEHYLSNTICALALVPTLFVFGMWIVSGGWIVRWVWVFVDLKSTCIVKLCHHYSIIEHQNEVIRHVSSSKRKKRSILPRMLDFS